MKRIRPVSWSLFLVEVIVLDKSFRIVSAHKTVVFFRAIPRISNGCLGEPAVSAEKHLFEGNECEGVRRIGEQGKVRDELVLGELTPFCVL